jgi:hypothetical protein
MSSLQKANEGRKVRAAARRTTMTVMAAQGKTDEQIGKELGVEAKTVRNNLVIARKEGLSVTEQDREELVDELLRIKADVEAHRKSDGKMPLQGVDRLIKIAEVIARIKLPARSENVNINADVDAEKLVGYRKFLFHTRHLTEVDINRLVYPFCDSLSPSETPQHLLEPNEDMRRGYVLEDSCEPTNS